MILIYHINDDIFADVAREIRSPMTAEMSQLLRTIAHLDWTIGHAEHRAISDKIDELKMMERLRLVRLLHGYGGYSKVASVDTDNLDEAYRLTQNGIVIESWSLLPDSKVKLIEPSYHIHNFIRYGRRSTSIGDIMQDKNKNFFVIDRFGFIPINFEKS